VRFVPDEAHREDIAQRGCDEMRIFANQQFQPLREILIGTHGLMKREIDLIVTPGVSQAELDATRSPPRKQVFPATGRTLQLAAGQFQARTPKISKIISTIRRLVAASFAAIRNAVVGSNFP
jgi:hypothetical protein